MPPKKQKKPLKKSCFDLVKDLNPDCITEEDVISVYKIKCTPCEQFRCRRNCKSNPYCLSELGEGQWLSENNEQEVPDAEDPLQLCRKPGEHIGLENLGATCYVNSLLQLWFHNPRFRRAIYNWCPLEDPVEQHNRILLKHDIYEPSCEIAHLQVLFALMSFSERSHLDPKDFVESLGLDTSTQQDAQEFSKLFISLLEERFKFQTNPLVQNMIAENFQGQYSYLTRCSRCQRESVSPSMFYELELNIMGHKTLDGSLAEFLEEEKLEGADKYSCSSCGDKQDAVRFIKLETLPPILNLQLMRFQYDRQKGYKKKLNSCLLFPEVLDMRKYVLGPENNNDDYDGDDEGCDENDNDESKEPIENKEDYIKGESNNQNEDKTKSEDYSECDINVKESRNKRIKKKDVEYMYNLTAVLAHKGNSANSGHYIAHIRDSSGLWYTFNDQSVKAEGKKLKLHSEENDDCSKSNTPRLPKGYLSSTKAYMLVYTRMDCDANSVDLQTLNDPSKVDSRLRTYVRRHNEKFKNWIEEETSVRKCFLASSNELKELMASIILSLPVEENSSLSLIEAISLDWITHWLKNAKETVNPIQNQHVMCPHDKLNPDCLSSVKFINKEAGDMLFEKYGSDSLRLIGDQIICKQCVLNKCKLFHSNNKLTEDFKEISNLLKVKMEEGDPGFWVDKESLKRWRQLARGDLENEFPDVNGYSVEPSEVMGPAHLKDSKNTKDDFKNVDLLAVKSKIPKFDDDRVLVSETSKETEVSVQESSVINQILQSENSMQNNNIVPSTTETQLSKNTNLRQLRFINRGNKTETLISSLAERNIPNGILHDTSVDSHQSLCNRNIPCYNNAHKYMEDILEYEKVSENLKTLLKSLFILLKNKDQLDISENIEKLADSQSMQFNKIKSIIMENCQNNNSCASKSNCYFRNTLVKNSKMFRKCGIFHKNNVIDNKNKSVLRTSDSIDSNNVNVNRAVNEHFVESDSVNSQDSVNYKCTASSETSEDDSAVEEKKDCESTNSSNNRKESPNGDLNNCVKQGDEDDSDKDEAEFNEGLICCHGNLTIDENVRRLVPVKVWEILKKYFPYSRTFPHNVIPCEKCQNLASEDEVVKDQFRKQAAIEKEQLKDLFLGKNRPDLEKIEILSTFYLLPADEFVTPWRQFLRKAGREEPLRSLNTSALICKHGLLAYCLMRDAKRFVLITEDEWKILSGIYESDCPISVTSIGDDVVQTYPESCDECRNERINAEKILQLNYENASLFVQKILHVDDCLFMVPPAELTTPAFSFNSKEDTNEPKKKKSKVDVPGECAGAALEGVRRSSRRRKIRDQKVVQVSSNLNLRDFKILIFTKFGVMPSDQHLIYEGRELVETAKTLAELQIYPESVIYLKIDEPTGNEEEACADVTKTREVEAGFKGTKLIS